MICQPCLASCASTTPVDSRNVLFLLGVFESSSTAATADASSSNPPSFSALVDDPAAAAPVAPRLLLARMRSPPNSGTAPSALPHPHVRRRVVVLRLRIAGALAARVERGTSGSVDRSSLSALSKGMVSALILRACWPSVSVSTGAVVLELVEGSA